jgi:3-deoxy-D-manno-octulosonic-acid transferase
MMYSAAIGLASQWNPKARLWVDGRKNWREKLKEAMASAGGRRTVWVHCASLGEFEQGRPVIEAIRRQHEEVFIVLSFFSPSGYEVRKNYEGADHVCYLPPDTRANARDFLDLVQPSLVIFVKYEYWLNLISEIRDRGIALLMISAIFRPGQVFFRWYGGKWRKALTMVDHFFVQDDRSAVLLGQLNVNGYTKSGDTRFDRVISIRDNFTPVPGIEEFCGGSQVIVAGSTWEEDEEAWDHYANTNGELRFIIAPHEVYEGHLRSIEKLFRDTIRYSSFSKNANSAARVLVIDNIGMLSRLYHYADICYIGGGFGAGIHNILEAAVHGKPVIFGPEYEKFLEAVEMIEEGAAFSISSALELEETVKGLLADREKLACASAKARAYVEGKAGATDKIMDYIQEKRLLTRDTN